jgi:glyoxylase-like metal-dependent hydrolase (beta-lactamase superfamily II)
MEIIAGIHKIEGVRGANCYLVALGTELLLIDTGMPGNGNKIINYVKGLGKNASDIKYVFLTHADIDHIGSAAKIKQMTGAQLVIHVNDAPILAGKSRMKTIKGPLGLIMKLILGFMRFHPVEPDVVVKEDTDIAGFKVIHTPGHTNGSISLYQPGKVIFVGDALKSDSRGNLNFPSRLLSADVVKATVSIMAIAELEFDCLLPGHGAPVKGQASAKVKNLLKRLG